MPGAPPRLRWQSWSLRETAGGWTLPRWRGEPAGGSLRRRRRRRGAGGMRRGEERIGEKNRRIAEAKGPGPGGRERGPRSEMDGFLERVGPRPGSEPSWAFVSSSYPAAAAERRLGTGTRSYVQSPEDVSSVSPVSGRFWGMTSGPCFPLFFV